MPAGKIKESLWLGTARIFLSSVQGQGGVRQLDGALGGLGDLGWPPKPKRPRVQVPAESNQGGNLGVPQLLAAALYCGSTLSPSFSDSLLSHFSLLHCLVPPPPPLSFLDRRTKKKKKTLHTLNMKPEVHVFSYVCACMCVGARVCLQALVCAGMCL